MRDYCPIKSKYNIPKSVWNRVIWLIRDRDRMQQEADNVIKYGSGSGLPAGHNKSPGDPVFCAAAKRERYLKEISIIDQTLEEIPPEYRKGIWQSIQGGNYPLDAARGTYSKWKSKYIYDVAEKIGYI